MNNPNVDNTVSEDFKKYSVAEIADMLGLVRQKPENSCKVKFSGNQIREGLLYFT